LYDVGRAEVELEVELDVELDVDFDVVVEVSIVLSSSSPELFSSMTTVVPPAT